jgi:hypothetical protein
MKWFALWLILAIAIAFVVGSLNVPLYERLITKGVQTKATVVELTPKIHNTVRYEYQVGGVKFEGQRSPWRPNPPTGELAVGDSLVIYYDPSNPSLSAPGDVGPMLTNELISVGMAALLMPTFIVFVLIPKQQERQKNRK